MLNAILSDADFDCIPYSEITVFWFCLCYSGKSREELIREKIMESEMRVAAQMGMSNPGTMTAGLTGLLTTTGTFLPANSS